MNRPGRQRALVPVGVICEFSALVELPPYDFVGFEPRAGCDGRGAFSFVTLEFSEP